MKKILALSSFFSISLLKQKASNLFVILAVLMIVVAYLFADIDIASRFKLFEDLLLTSQMGLLHLAAVFYMFDFLQRDNSHGIFILPLSTNLTREQYLMSIFMTLFRLLATLFFIFMVLDVGMLFFIEETFRISFLWQLFLFTFSSLLLGSMVIMFSQYVSIMNAVIYSITVFILGSGLDELYIYVNYIGEVSDLSKTVGSALYYILPNFSQFDIQSKVVNLSSLDIYKDVMYPLIYAIGLFLIIYLLSAYRYKKKVLKVGE